MSKKRHPAVGIDLGTTYSVVARLDDAGRPTTLVNAEGDLTTPSVVLIDGEEVVVGKEALKAVGTDADCVATCAKRDVGKAFYRQRLGNKQFPPEVLQAAVLLKLKNDAARIIGDFRHVVVTVPAYFDEVRRKCTQDAGLIAGLKVMDIINEPTAAAVSFGYQQGILSENGESKAPVNVLVYDLGGGTFDVTLMNITGKEFRTISTDGDVQLGGQDWDQRIVNFVAEEFLKQHNLDPRHDPGAAARLWLDCEDAKRTLSSRGKATVTCHFQGVSSRVELTREKFQELTHDLIDRTEFTVRQTLRAGKLGWDAIDRILMVGGSSRMPMVASMLQRLSGLNPDASVSADEAIAHGAALHAGFILARHAGDPTQFKIKNVNSHSLGVAGIDPQTDRPRTVKLIPRNTPLPAEASREFKTRSADQSSLVVKIVEGESPTPDACTQIGSCVIREMPRDLPAGTPVKVTFRYGANGRLNVAVKIAQQAEEIQQEISRPTGLSADEIEHWKNWLAERLQ